MIFYINSISIESETEIQLIKILFATFSTRRINYGAMNIHAIMSIGTVEIGHKSEINNLLLVDLNCTLFAFYRFLFDFYRLWLSQIVIVLSAFTLFILLTKNHNSNPGDHLLISNDGWNVQHIFCISNCNAKQHFIKCV